jgi:uncharacterized protein (DUF2345 family)
MPSFAAPLNVQIGRVIAAFQGTHTYEVQVDNGRLSCTYHGLGQGAGGVQHAGGVMPGSLVYVALRPGHQDGVILATVQPGWAVYDTDPQQFCVYPQVSGFEPSVTPRTTGNPPRIVTQLLQSDLIDTAYNPTLVGQDLNNGEWGVISPYGAGGVGVEMFRSWVKGGPMSGLTCFHDTELTRLQGMDYEFLTFGRSDYAHRHGNSIVEVRSKVNYPSEALADQLPRTHEIAGPIHGGSHRFVTTQSNRGQPRLALLHEHIADDGAYCLTSASAIHLQRYCGIVVPEESQAPGAASNPTVTEQPLDPDEQRQIVLTTPRPFVSLPSGERSGLGWVQATLDQITGLVEVRGWGGFDRLPAQWPSSGRPAQLPQDTFHTSYDAGMWRALPQSVTVQIDPIIQAKTFYVGRSSFSLMPDGSVVVEDAYHSQIIMSGGNIMLSAPHDIVLQAGRHMSVISGGHIGVKANKNLDLTSNTQAVSIKAEAQLSLLGGANGTAGGVLIESKSLQSDTVVGSGANQVVGGILLKSRTGAYMTGSLIGIKATDANVVLESPLSIDLRSDAIMSLYAPDGVVVSHDNTGANSGHSLTSNAFTTQSVIAKGSLDVLGGALIAQGLAVGGPAVAHGGLGCPAGAVGKGDVEIQKPIDAINKVFKQVSSEIATNYTGLQSLLNLSTPLSKTVLAGTGFTFWSSPQLGLNGSGGWLLPESLWQAVSRQGQFGLTKPWVEKPVASVSGDNLPTAPFPGYEAWNTPGSYRIQGNNLYVDLATGATILPSDLTKAVLPASTLVPANNNLLIGADNA